MEQNPNSEEDQSEGTENDDVISTGNGNDTIIASPGNDTLDGGEGRDTYIVGPIVLADPVVTTADFTTSTDLSAIGYPEVVPPFRTVLQLF